MRDCARSRIQPFPKWTFVHGGGRLPVIPIPAETMNDSLPSSLRPEIRPHDRLGFTLLIAALLHAAIILGVGFAVEELPAQSRGLEVTLASFASDRAPDKADYIAQADQLGSGTLEHEATPSTDEQAPVQDSEIKEVSVESTVQPPKPREETAPVLATRQPSPQKVKQPERPKPVTQPERQAPVMDRDQLAADIASLEAEFAMERQKYAKRPRVSHQHTASTRRDVSAWYRDDWRKKVERIGNLNYPDEARRNRIYGSLRLLVVIRSDGTIERMAILESSGQAVLDQAALNIVRLSAPFAPFTGELAARYDQVEIIRTWRFERGDRLSSQ